jgi:hypothetical protein
MGTGCKILVRKVSDEVILYHEKNLEVHDENHLVVINAISKDFLSMTNRERWVLLRSMIDNK